MDSTKKFTQITVSEPDKNTASYLFSRIQYYKQINPDLGLDHFEVGRHTYCHLIWFPPSTESKKIADKYGFHKFEVRNVGIENAKYGIIRVSAVCWTAAAGPCSIQISDENAKDFKILEDEPTLQVLYG